MCYISKEELESSLKYSRVIDALEQAFKASFHMPDRHHHFYKTGSTENTLLLMPAWNTQYMGVKQVISAPGNARLNKPSIQGVYSLMDLETGEPLALMDARYLTAVRTACASALAAKYLARKDAETLLVIGGGEVALQLIGAHLAVRNYKQVLVWMRRPEAFETFRKRLGPLEVPLNFVHSLEAGVLQADVVTAATLTKVPLILGEWLQEGQHLDLIGSFKMDMREADDAAILKSRVYVDSLHGALYESGELGIPVQKGLIQAEHVLGDLQGLCQGQVSGRKHAQELTLFKSVGMAIEDLATAILVYQQIQG